MIKALIGDLFESQAQTLVNTVNCVGVMGKGVAAEFRKRFPAMFDDYVARCDAGEVKLGAPYLWEELAGAKILNFPTKGHWRAATRLSDVEAGLDYLVHHYQEWGITSIALPPLGCGNGGLDWEDVGPLIFEKLGSLNLDVEMYAPYGTPKNQLKEEFFASVNGELFDKKGSRNAKFNPQWVVLMEVLRELEAQRYASPVGRTIFQKICYIVTAMGVKTEFEFSKNSYGPFSEDVKAVVVDFSNRNWIREEQLGPMMAVRVGEQYLRERKKYREIIEANEQKIGKVVDLFSRIKNTDQAEEMITVLYSCRVLKENAQPGTEVTQDDLFRYILDWKKKWDTLEKRESIRDSVFSLMMLNWMKLSVEEGNIDDQL